MHRILGSTLPLLAALVLVGTAFLFVSGHDATVLGREASAQSSPIREPTGAPREQTGPLESSGAQRELLAAPIAELGVGALLVSFAGDFPAEPHRLRVFSPGVPAFEISRRLDSNRPQRFERLPAASVHVQLVEDDRVVDHREVHLRAGQESSVSLSFPALVDLGEYATVHGMIELPEAAVRGSLGSALEVRIFPTEQGVVTDGPRAGLRRDGFVEDPDRKGRYYFTSPPLPLGPKRVELSPLGHVVHVELLPGGTFADLILPELSHTEVRFRDRAGDPVDLDHLIATREGSPGSPPAILHAVPLGEPGCFAVTATAGRIRLSTSSPEHHPRTIELDVAAVREVVELELAVVHRFEVSVLREGRVLSFPPGWWMDLELEPVDLDERFLGLEVAFSDGALLDRAAFTVSGPGTYRVTLPPLDEGGEPSTHDVHVHDSSDAPFQLEP